MPDLLTLTLPDEAATAALAAALAPRLKAGDALLLQGPLGAGKTSFARAAIRALCGPGTEVPSPSFNLVLTYDTPAGPLWHVDLYRVADPREVDELGLEEIFTDGIVLIEWPDRLGPDAPRGALTLSLLPTTGSSRTATFQGAGDWVPRLSDLKA
jgi:tRNA threonylcarbamoyladenosine biosynthesis protein TsaE